MGRDMPAAEDVRDILLIQLGDIGDVVLTFPCVTALKARFSRARIHLAVREKAAPLVQYCPDAWGAVPIRRARDSAGFLGRIQDQWRFFRGLRRQGFDLALDMRTGDRGAILAFLSGASRRAGFYDRNGNIWRNRVFHQFSFTEYRPQDHILDYHLGLLRDLGIEPADPRPRMRIPRKRSAAVPRLFANAGLPSNAPVVALQPFSLWAYKEWGLEKYARLADALTTDFPVSVVLMGGAGETKRGQGILARCRRPVYSLIGRTDMAELPAVLAACRLFVGIDSAGLHIAAAVGTPTVGIFGPSSPVTWAPPGPAHRVVHKDYACVPCRQKGCRGTEVSRCLNDLSVSEVLAVAAPRLKAVLEGP